jgi:hypothetical protein
MAVELIPETSWVSVVPQSVGNVQRSISVDDLLKNTVYVGQVCLWVYGVPHPVTKLIPLWLRVADVKQQWEL